MFKFIDSLRLTLTQWLLLFASIVIGVLVLANKDKSRKLSKLQLDIMKSRADKELESIAKQMKTSEEKVKAFKLQEKYAEMRKRYSETQEDSK
jgi:ribonuclease HIII